LTDHGYMGLYNGERAKDIHARKGLKKGQHILDWMGHTELAANLFRATQAENKIRREGSTSKDAANQAHHDVGRCPKTCPRQRRASPRSAPASRSAELRRDRPSANPHGLVKMAPERATWRLRS
jgi:DNA-damage-inducible protein D